MTIRFIKNYFNHSDARGYINGLLNEGSWQELNFIYSQQGAIRGNHYHKQTEECFVILEGIIEISLNEIVHGVASSKTETFTVKKGDVFIIYPNTLHSFNIIEDATWINALSIKTDEKKPDIHRL